MRESILTIPISEIFDPRCGCPICRMRDMLENRTIEYIMGAAMMEPDVRLESNRLGFCSMHYDQMQKQKNRLSLALMLQTHLEELEKSELSKKISNDSRKLFKSKTTESVSYVRTDNSCFVCDKIQWGMERLMKTLFEMYGNAEFHTLFMQQEYICMPHFRLLRRLAPSYLSKGNLSAFYEDVKTLTGKHLQSLYQDVSHYCSMYDYRNTGADADWGNSRDSIERAISFLTAREMEK